MTVVEPIAVEKTKLDIEEPGFYKVILLNDNVTPMEFVISVLIEIFKHTHDTARDIMLQVHETGSGIAGTYSFEIAEQRGLEATQVSRTNGFPLQIRVEEE